MRVSEERTTGAGGAGPAGAGGAGAARGRAGFGSALRRAQGRPAGTTEAAGPPGAERGTTGVAEGVAGRCAAGRRAPLAPREVARRRTGGAERGGGSGAGPGGGPTAAGPGPGAVAAGSAPPPAAPAVASAGPDGLAEAGRVALASAVRSVPPIIEAFRRGGREALSLDLGAALGIELRRVPGGVALVLAASPGLAPAARSELPHLVRSLSARGVAVAHAEVRERAGAGGSRR